MSAGTTKLLPLGCFIIAVQGTILFPMLLLHQKCCSVSSTSPSSLSRLEQRPGLQVVKTRYSSHPQFGKMPRNVPDVFSATLRSPDRRNFRTDIQMRQQMVASCVGRGGKHIKHALLKTCASVVRISRVGVMSVQHDDRIGCRRLHNRQKMYERYRIFSAESTRTVISSSCQQWRPSCKSGYILLGGIPTTVV
jgi:hypothetical protein